MELLKQLQKKRKIIKVIFLILFIFFNCTAFLYAKVFSSILNIEGAFIQGSILFGKTKPNSKIIFNDKKIFVNNEGDFLLGISRDEKKENLETKYEHFFLAKPLIPVPTTISKTQDIKTSSNPKSPYLDPSSQPPRARYVDLDYGCPPDVDYSLDGDY